jgi:CheY-like chemotaxis protein
VANNGQEALDQLSVVPPDHYHVVFMDLQMPVMDGYEATRRMRADPRYYAQPLVAMTAHAMAEERERCKAMGMNGHLSKPIEPEDLYAMLSRYYTQVSKPDVAVKLGSPVVKAVIPVVDNGLPVVEGLDTSSGLRRAGKNVKLYRKMLETFVSDYADYHQTFMSYMSNAQWGESERLAHTLKGLTATLGASEVAIPAGDLESASKANQVDESKVALEALMLKMTPLISELQRYFSETALVEDSPVDVSVVKTSGLPECLPKLKALLSEGDSDAIDLWDKHQKEFARALSTQAAHAIDMALQNFEFDTALALLGELPAELA